jgi:hypothetical protein
MCNSKLDLREKRCNAFHFWANSQNTNNYSANEARICTENLYTNPDLHHLVKTKSEKYFQSPVVSINIVFVYTISTHTHDYNNTHVTLKKRVV